MIGLPGLLPAPRTAVAYMLVCAAEVAARSASAPRIADRDRGRRRLPRERREDLRHRRRDRRRNRRRPPVIYGAGATAAVARRWKTQVNENAKLPAFCSELPEANHNEICGWGEAARDAGSPRSCSRTATSTRASAAASS